MSLRGQTALITGASRGIGRAIALALAREGVRLTLVGRSDALAHTTAEIGRLTEVHAVGADVTRAAEVEAVFLDVRDRFGSLDILVNNAGIAEAASVVDTTPELWNETIAVNLTATYLCTRQAVPLMAGRGHILNIISNAAIVPFPNNAAYCAAKAGALAFTRVLREEVRASGIRVTALLPGATDTDLWNRLMPNAPREKMMQADDVAEVALHALTMPATAVAEEIILNPPCGRL